MDCKPILFSGSSNLSLAQEISELADIPLGKLDIHLFPDHEIFVEILESVYKRDVIVLQSLAFHPNHYLMELLIIIDALKRASAASITVVMPYYGYARQDRLNKPGVPITAKLVANLLVRAGTNRLITLDLHSEQIEGFFDIPVENLSSSTLLIPYCAQLHLEDAIVVAPDKGGVKIASAYAKQLGTPTALIDKERIDPSRVETHLFIGHVKNYTVLLPDDMCSTGATLVHAAETCMQLGAKCVVSAVGHGLFIGDALEKIEKSPIEFLVTTNSVAISEKVRVCSKIRVVSIAPLFAQTIRNSSRSPC